MSTDILIAENDTHRVIANLDYSPHTPEFQGLPEAIISLYDSTAYFTEAWNGSLNEDAILNAFNSLNREMFTRWIKIFEDDLVNRSVAAVDDDELIFAHVSVHHGYSQGDSWIQIVWSSTDNPTPNYVSDLVNWARGDVYFLSLEKKSVYSLIDSEEEDTLIQWNEIDSIHGYYTDDPENCEYIKDEAVRMLADATA